MEGLLYTLQSHKVFYMIMMKQSYQFKMT